MAWYGDIKNRYPSLRAATALALALSGIGAGEVSAGAIPEQTDRITATPSPRPKETPRPVATNSVEAASTRAAKRELLNMPENLVLDDKVNKELRTTPEDKVVDLKQSLVTGVFNVPFYGTLVTLGGYEKDKAGQVYFDPTIAIVRQSDCIQDTLRQKDLLGDPVGVGKNGLLLAGSFNPNQRMDIKADMTAIPREGANTVPLLTARQIKFGEDSPVECDNKSRLSLNLSPEAIRNQLKTQGSILRSYIDSFAEGAKTKIK